MLTRTTLIALVIFSVGEVHAEDNEVIAMAQAIGYVREQVAQRELRLASERESLAEAQTQNQKNGHRERIKWIESDEFQPDLVGTSLGDCGKTLGCRVLQVISSSELLVEIAVRPSRTRYTPDKHTAWISNVSTNGLVDGDTVDIGVGGVMGTKSYTTVLGANRTIIHIRAFNSVDWREVAKLQARRVVELKAEAIAQAKAKAEDSKKPFRTWQDSSGQFSIEARFTSFAAGVLKITTDDSREIEVPLEKLSEADREYVNGLFRK
jgi:hypothetical protein